MKAVQPASGQVLRDYPEHDREDAERLLTRAVAAFQEWRQRSFAERATLLTRVANRLRGDRSTHARLITSEMGKPITQSEAEIEKCAWVCEHFAKHASDYLANQSIATDATSSYVRCDPLGVLLAIMPWNFPYWQVFRAAAPALMAGNVVVLKHASNVPGCALAIERCFHEAGLPDGVFSTLLVRAPVAEALVAHPAVSAVTLTGSEGAGMAVARRAGESLKKCVLELGGSDPFIVLADADPAWAAGHAVTARTLNNGQSCIAAKRFLVEAPVAQAFETELTQRMALLAVGDPADPQCDIGPLARQDLVDELDAQVRASVERGATLSTGGQRLDRPGFYYAPTVLTGVVPGMPAFDEETFGPVAAVVRVADTDEAVSFANHTCYGLGASVWTADAARGEALAARIEAGAVFVNGIVKSDPRLPFGGIKRSGYGRELSTLGIREFVNQKTVWVA